MSFESDVFRAAYRNVSPILIPEFLYFSVTISIPILKIQSVPNDSDTDTNSDTKP